jgi:phospholipid transport system substrate-binding protein
MSFRKVLTVTVLAAAFAGQARAAEDPAAIQVDKFCHAVLQATAGASGGSGLQARTQQLLPLIDQHFDIGAMAHFAVGEPWAQWSAADRAVVVNAMSRFTAARYASALEASHGQQQQQCVVDPAVVTRGPDKLVKSKMVEGGTSTSVNYRLRESGGAWKVIDVYYEGASQLLMQRADFAAIIRDKGAPGVVAKLKELTAKMR